MACNWAANASHASAALSIGPDPGPAYIKTGIDLRRQQIRIIGTVLNRLRARE